MTNKLIRNHRTDTEIQKILAEIKILKLIFKKPPVKIVSHGCYPR